MIITLLYNSKDIVFLPMMYGNWDEIMGGRSSFSLCTCLSQLAFCRVVVVVVVVVVFVVLVVYLS